MARHLFYEERERRRELAARHVDRTVEVDIWPGRDEWAGNYTITGRVIAVASPVAGSGADQLIVQTGHATVSISLATVATIKEVTR